MGAPRGAVLLAAALLSACARHAVTLRAAEAVATPDEVQVVVRLALMLDAAGDRAADTLYTADALIVANARVRLAVPRFAGISSGGRVTIAASSVTLEGRFAWVLMDYRWVNPQQRLAEAGRATFICERRAGAGGWKIVHVHSSQVLPWDR